jgi:hypothetical protein
VASRAPPTSISSSFTFDHPVQRAPAATSREGASRAVAPTSTEAGMAELNGAAVESRGSASSVPPAEPPTERLRASVGFQSTLPITPTPE